MKGRKATPNIMDELLNIKVTNPNDLNQHNTVIPEQHNAVIPEQHNAVVPEQHNAVVPEQHNAVVPEQHNAVVPEQHNAVVPEQHNAVVPEQHNAVVPEQHNAVVPEQHNAVVPEQHSIINKPLIENKTKATYYVSQKLIEEMDEAWFDLRRLLKPTDRGKFSKSLFVELAVKRAIEDFRINGEKSNLLEEIISVTSEKIIN